MSTPSSAVTAVVVGAAFTVASAILAATAATESWCRAEEARLAQPSPEYLAAAAQFAAAPGDTDGPDANDALAANPLPTDLDYRP